MLKEQNMPSYYERIIALESLEKKISDLNEQLYKKSIVMRNLQKKCPHEIIIHYGDDKLSQMYQQSYVLGDFYCPLCGQRSFRIQHSAEGKAFVLEASGYKNPNPKINLKEVLDIYKSCALNIHLADDVIEVHDPNFNPAEELVKHIQQVTGLAYYRVNVIEW